MSRAFPLTINQVVNPHSSTDRNPDRNSTDDDFGAPAATDTHLGTDNSGSVGNPHDSNKACLGQCKRENPRLLWISRVSRQPARVPVLRGKIFSYRLFDGQTRIGSLLMPGSGFYLIGSETRAKRRIARARSQVWSTCEYNGRSIIQR
jgi:hypothetical protein